MARDRGPPIDTAAALAHYSASRKGTNIKLAFTRRARSAWPNPAFNNARAATVRTLAQYDGPGANAANLLDASLVSTYNKEHIDVGAEGHATDAIAASRRQAYETCKQFMKLPALRAYHTTFHTWLSTRDESKKDSVVGLAQQPPIYIFTKDDPILAELERKDFLLDVFNPFLNKRHGLARCALPHNYVWDRAGNLTPGWGGFIRNLSRGVVVIALMQLALDVKYANGSPFYPNYYSYARHSPYTEQWVTAMDAELNEWLEIATARGAIPANQFRSAIDDVLGATVYIPT